VVSHISPRLFFSPPSLSFLYRFFFSFAALGISQNYFDKQGIFCGIFLSAPLLLIGFAQLLSTLFEATELLGDVAKAKAQSKPKKETKSNKKNSGSDSAKRKKQE
jgi:hypothetical protein